MGLYFPFVFFVLSCNHKDLLIEDNELYSLNVAFDFSEVDNTPSAMRVLFYPLNFSGGPYKFDVSGDGGIVTLPEGNYNVLAYNIDTENILEANEDSYNGFYLTTRSYEVATGEVKSNDPTSKARMVRNLFGNQVPKAAEEEDFPLYDSPEWTCCCRYEGLHLDPQYKSVTTDGVRQQSMLLKAQNAVYAVNFEVGGIEGLEWASHIRGTLSGIAGGMMVAECQPAPLPGMVSFTAKVDKERSVITGTFFVWGYVPSDESDTRQFMDIYIWGNTGNYFLTQEVTDILHKASEGGSASIMINMKADIDMMDEAEGDSGFKPNVGDWEEHHNSISL